jgi:hypothetical protein
MFEIEKDLSFNHLRNFCERFQRLSAFIAHLSALFDFWHVAHVLFQSGANICRGYFRSFAHSRIPVTLALLISIFDWQETMVIVAASCLFLFMPISLGLLQKTDRYQQPPQTNLESGEVGGKIWTRKDVLQIPFFYFSVPMALLIPSASVFATALSPVLFGWLIDLGVPITAIVVGGIVLTMLVSILAFLAPDPSKKTDSQFLSIITSNN